MTDDDAVQMYEVPGERLRELVDERDEALQKVERLKNTDAEWRAWMNDRNMVMERMQEWATRIERYEDALREIAIYRQSQDMKRDDPSSYDWRRIARKQEDIARAALSGSEPPSIPGSGDGMHGEDR